MWQKHWQQLSCERIYHNYICFISELMFSIKLATDHKKCGDIYYSCGRYRGSYHLKYTIHLGSDKVGIRLPSHD